MDATLQTALMAAGTAPVNPPAPTRNAETATKAAKDFESMFISQFLGAMFSGIPTDGPFGGGEGEKMFRSLMMNQYAKAMESRGGFGLASAVSRELLSHQETPRTAAAVS